MKYNCFLITAAIFLIGEMLAAPMTYVSQCGQDKILNEHLFKSKKNGVFVDIGAHNGISFSNTYFFEKYLNWKGICFEPMPDQFKTLKVNRKCTCINACVSENEGNVPFILVDSPIFHVGMLSGMVDTYDPRHFERMKADLVTYGGSYKIIDVPSVRLEKILNDMKIKQIDYLSVDTEGGELNFLKTIDFKKFNITAISVENNYKDPELKTFLNTQGFTLVACFHGYDELYINNIYITELKPIPSRISNLSYKTSEIEKI